MMAPRLLLLLPTRGYRAQAFMDAASRLDVQLTIASEEASSVESLNPAGLISLSFTRPQEAVEAVREFARAHPLDAVVGVDDTTTQLQAEVAAALGLPSHPPSAAAAARNKFIMRETLQAAGLPGPSYRLFSTEQPPDYAGIPFPCVLKPLVLSGSRGVIRANSRDEFVSAFCRIRAILQQPEIASAGPAAGQILVESYIHGREVALEGLVTEGELHVLALFDKPDPLDGPYFEETIYVTPSRLSAVSRGAAVAMAAKAAEALGLKEGPVHVELRVEAGAATIIEINPRSIGGRCSRVLRFGAEMSLEEIILRQALRLPIPSLQREAGAAGAMMVPIPRGGTLVEWHGEDEARAVPGVTGVEMTAHLGQQLVPLPEGSAYLGFIFAAGPHPNQVEAALRRAHRALSFNIE